MSIALDALFVLIGFIFGAVLEKWKHKKSRLDHLIDQAESLVDSITDKTSIYLCVPSDERERHSHCALVLNDLKRLSGLLSAIGVMAHKNGEYFLSEHIGFNAAVTSPPFNEQQFELFPNDCERMREIRNREGDLKRKLRDST